MDSKVWKGKGLAQDPTKWWQHGALNDRNFLIFANWTQLALTSA